MNKKKLFKTLFQKPDVLLFIVTLALCICGLVLIQSASETPVRDGIVQGAAMLIGLVVMTVLTWIDYDYFRALWPFAAGFSAFLLVLVLLIGIGGEEVGTTGWISLGPVSLQPSELAKIGFIITFSCHLNRVRERVSEFKHFMLLMLHFGAYAGLVLLQPDFGTAMVFAVIALGMLFIAGLDWRYFLAMGILLPVTAVGGYFFLLKDYQKKRIFTFLNPESDPTGAGYHVLQSKIAIGSGQLTGNGYKNGPITQNGLLPAAKTDFVFGALGEEFGFFACILLLFLLFFMIWRTFYAAINAKDSFGELLCVGVGAMLSFHVIENVGMCIGLLPVTGIPLPLISHGGSNVLATMMALGIVQSVVVHRRAVHFQ